MRLIIVVPIHVPSNDDMFTSEHILEDSCSISYDDYNDEYNIFSSPTIEEDTRYDYNMPPIFDDYGDENSYFVEFAPTTIVHVGSINLYLIIKTVRFPLSTKFLDRFTLALKYILPSMPPVSEKIV
jgi:hypothetical protein